jgi:signal transduction histidine kinase
MKSYSLKKRLIGSVLLVEIVSALAISGLAFLYERHTHFVVFDIMLRGRADVLLGAVQDAEDEHDSVMLDGSQDSLPERDVYEVWDDSSRVLGKSPNWEGLNKNQLADFAANAKTLRQGKKEYRSIRVDGIRTVDPGDKGGGIPRKIIIIYGSPTAPVWRSIWTAVEFYALASALLLGFTGFIMLRLLNESLAPLKDLTEEAAKVSVNSWSFHPSERLLQTVELAPLAIALETALQGLERSFLQERRFIGDAAHELKTAVAVVKSSLQLLMLKPRTVGEYRAGLERCERDCERMQNLVGEMLTLARIENDPIRASGPQPKTLTDLTKVAREVVHRFASLAEMNGISIRLEAPESAALDIEEEDMELLCSNLLLNAIQHSQSQGLVQVRIEQTGSSVDLWIIDEGTGIHPDAQPHIFERFYRGDPSRSRSTGGTGLGLSICEALVKKSQGQIHVESELGRGTRVLVRLPISSVIAVSA